MLASTLGGVKGRSGAEYTEKTMISISNKSEEIKMFEIISVLMI